MGDNDERATFTPFAEHRARQQAREDQALTDGFAALAMCRTCGALVIDARGHHRYHEAQRKWSKSLVDDIERMLRKAGFRRRGDRAASARRTRPDTEPSV